MSFSLGGIASGLDTQTIIKQLMDLERIPYSKLENRQKTFNNEISIFRSINTKLASLRTAAEDLRLSANFNLRNASNSDETVLKASVSETATEANYTIHVTQLASRHTMKSREFDIAGSSLSGTFTITGNGKTKNFHFDDGEATTDGVKLDKLADEINKADLGIKASVIETSPGRKTITFTTDKSGYDHQITLEEAPTETEENVYVHDSGNLLGMQTATPGRDAMLTVNGVNIKASSNELNDTIPGLSLTLLKLGESTISVSRDADKIADKVDAFVKAYNDVVNTIRTNTAKGAGLQGDSTLRTLQDQLSSLFNSQVGEESSEYNFLFQIGLEIDKGLLKGSEMTGTIQFDKEKFKSALAENPDAVIQLFTHFNEIDGQKNGIAEKFSETLRVWTRSGTGILAARIEGYDEQISFIVKQMEDMEIRLGLKEEQLRKQFNGMETVLLSLQNQMSWLNSQINSLSNF